MKEFIKKPENWGRIAEAKPADKRGQVRNTDVAIEQKVDVNRARIEATIAEIKAKFQSKK